MKKHRSTTEMARGIFASALNAIEREIAAIETGSSRSDKFQPAERIAYLAKQAASFFAEDRKAQSAARKESAGVDEAAILAHVRTLSPDRRSSLVRKIQQLDERRSVLG